MDRLRIILPKIRFKYAWQAFILVLVAYAAVSVRWSILLRHFKIKQRIMDSWRYYMVGAFYSTVLPGAIGGDVVRLGLSVRSHGQSRALLATSILFERASGIMVILMMASIASLFLPIFFENEPFLKSLILGISLGVLTIFILFFVILKTFSSSWFDKFQSRTGWMQSLANLLLHFRNLPLGVLFIFLLLSVLAHCFDILGSFFLNKAIQINQPLPIFFLIMPLVYVLTTIPISVGGVGVREGVLTMLMVKVGVVASDAVLLAFVIYLNRILVSLIGGIFQFIDPQSIPLKKNENLP